MKPVLQALVLADHVYVDVYSGKKVIAGTFSALFSDRFPCVLGRPTHAYISMTEAEVGLVALELRYVDLSNDQVLMKTDIEVKSQGPLSTVDFISEVPPIPMPHDGAYAFELLWNNELVGSLRVTVNKVPKAPEETSDPGEED